MNFLLRLIGLWLRALQMARKRPPYWKMLRWLFRGRRASRSLWRKRMLTCFRCPIFDRRHFRCSSVLGLTHMGCDCSMPLKAMDADATCWARDHGQPMGWEE